ncbi:MAG: hypothetical protein Q7T04_01550 [Dehalococcoidia bacterium]|nr:hypothetical protein [Dehalococcoidia bacterium]
MADAAARLELARQSYPEKFAPEDVVFSHHLTGGRDNTWKSD